MWLDDDEPRRVVEISFHEPLKAPHLSLRSSPWAIIGLAWPCMAGVHDVLRHAVSGALAHIKKGGALYGLMFALKRSLYSSNRRKFDSRSESIF